MGFRRNNLRELITEIDGKRYFRDDVKGEYRNVNNPSDVIEYPIHIWTGVDFTEVSE